MSTSYAVFATATPGLEDLLAAEIEGLFPGLKKTLREGGVELRLDREGLWTLAHETRLAEAIRVRIKRFEARSFAALEEGLSRIPWAAYLPRDVVPEISVSARKSKLIHTGGIEERVRRALGPRRLQGGATIYVRVSKDKVTISVDAAGERLHRRGGGKHVGSAPLRETLAAACLRSADYGGEATLWDPFCGSGTFLTEALDHLGAVPKTRQRNYAYEGWPSHSAEAYQGWLSERQRPAARVGSVIGSDVEPAMVKVATHNLEAYDATRWTLHTGDFEEVSEKIPAGTWVITNLPYGKRLALDRKLLARFGAWLKSRNDLGPVFVLTATDDLGQHTGIGWKKHQTFRNGGLRVFLWEMK